MGVPEIRVEELKKRLDAGEEFFSSICAMSSNMRAATSVGGSAHRHEARVVVDSHKGIAVRGGHHCAQPILRRFGLESTVRATLAFYNNCEEIEVFVAALWDLHQGRGAGLA